MEFEEFVLAASTGDLSQEPIARGHAHAVEFRMDLATSPLAALDEYAGQLPVLATNRVEWEGGQAPAGEERIETLVSAVEHPQVEAIDIELAAIEEGDMGHLFGRAARHDTKVIVSLHDFEGTPDRDRLDDLLASACEYGDVGKLAVTARSLDDALDLLAATRAATADGCTVATMAMGEAGQHTRAVAPLYGSRIGYAPVDPAEATAPGQYPLSTLADLVATLRGG